jgi:hypothetical protein
MRKKTATGKDAAQTPAEAGATPPFDAPCVTGPFGVAPASVARKSRQDLGRVQISEVRSGKEEVSNGDY